MSFSSTVTHRSWIQILKRSQRWITSSPLVSEGSFQIPSTQNWIRALAVCSGFLLLLMRWLSPASPSHGCKTAGGIRTHLSPFFRIHVFSTSPSGPTTQLNNGETRPRMLTRASRTLSLTKSQIYFA